MAINFSASFAACLAAGLKVPRQIMYCISQGRHTDAVDGTRGRDDGVVWRSAKVQDDTRTDATAATTLARTLSAHCTRTTQSFTNSHIKTPHFVPSTHSLIGSLCRLFSIECAHSIFLKEKQTSSARMTKKRNSHTFGNSIK